ncbi:MAG TPA: hypothetical protein VHE80_07155 [Acidimicrobiales bacterium]|nr:hypothetical protein [Acidimicrobiales bacterium]
MKLRMESLWGRPRSREQLEEEANEELARVAGGGPGPAEMVEPATDGGGDMAPGGDAEVVAAEPEVAGAGPDAIADEPDAVSAADGVQDWQERMAEVRQGRR